MDTHNQQVRRSAVASLMAAVAVSVLLAVAGCGGAGLPSESTGRATAEELLDLRQAYESGKISESDYKRKREEILDRE